MAKDWNKTCAEMCARAHMLEDALDKASKNDLRVKPVNRFAKDIEEENMKESRKKHRTKGAETGSFFSIHSIESACTMEMEEKLSNNSLEDEKRVETNEILTEVKILLKRRNWAKQKSFDETQSLDEIEIVSLEPSSRPHVTCLMAQLTIKESFDL